MEPETWLMIIAGVLLLLLVVVLVLLSFLVYRQTSAHPPASEADKYRKEKNGDLMDHSDSSLHYVEKPLLHIKHNHTGAPSKNLMEEPTYDTCCKSKIDPSKKWRSCKPCEDEIVSCPLFNNKKTCNKWQPFCSWHSGSCYNTRKDSYAKTIQCDAAITTKTCIKDSQKSMVKYLPNISIAEEDESFSSTSFKKVLAPGGNNLSHVAYGESLNRPPSVPPIPNANRPPSVPPIPNANGAPSAPPTGAPYGAPSVSPTPKRSPAPYGAPSVSPTPNRSPAPYGADQTSFNNSVSPAPFQSSLKNEMSPAPYTSPGPSETSTPKHKNRNKCAF